MKRFRKILVATDLSPNSTPAYRKAIEIAEVNGAQLLIATAYEPPNPIVADAVAPGVYGEWNARLQGRVATEVQALVDDARSRGIDASPAILPGDPEEAIVRSAQENGVDLIVMGTHGRRGAARLFVGSVAAGVLANATCPVMTVRSAI